MDPRGGLDDAEKREFSTLPAFALRPLSRPVRSQSLYRLRYLGSTHTYTLDQIRDRTRDAAVGSQLLTAWAMVRPK
jgi:hypothetical protein